MILCKYLLLNKQNKYKYNYLNLKIGTTKYTVKNLYLLFQIAFNKSLLKIYNLYGCIHKLLF